jgi:hypothetical protein
MPVITPPFAPPSTRVYPNSGVMVHDNTVFYDPIFAYDEEGEHDPNPEPHLSPTDAFRTADWDKTDGFIADVLTHPALLARIIKVTVGGRKFFLRNTSRIDPHGYTFMAMTLADAQQ